MDEAEKYLEDYGSISIAVPLLAKLGEDFSFDLKQGATNYYTDAKTQVQAAAAGFQQTVQSLSINAQAQMDPTVAAAYAAQLQDYFTSLQRYHTKQSLNDQAALQLLQANLAAANTNSDPAARQTAAAQALQNYAQQYSASSNSPVFPTSQSTSNLPSLTTDLPPRPGVTNVLSGQQFLPFQGLLNGLNVQPTVKDRSAILTTAGDIATESIFRHFMGNTNLASEALEDNVYFGFTTVSVDPGWRTSRGWAAEAVMTAEIRYTPARKSVVERYINNLAVTNVPIIAPAILQGHGYAMIPENFQLDPQVRLALAAVKTAHQVATNLPGLTESFVGASKGTISQRAIPAFADYGITNDMASASDHFDSGAMQKLLAHLPPNEITNASGERVDIKDIETLDPATRKRLVQDAIEKLPRNLVLGNLQEDKMQKLAFKAQSQFRPAALTNYSQKVAVGLYAEDLARSSNLPPDLESNLIEVSQALLNRKIQIDDSPAAYEEALGTETNPVVRSLLPMIAPQKGASLDLAKIYGNIPADLWVETNDIPPTSVHVTIISPLVDADVTDLSSSVRSQNEFALALSFALRYAGMAGQAKAFEQFVKNNQTDVRTRGTLVEVNAFSGNDGKFGFQVGPHLAALGNPTKKSAKAEMVLERQSFPALLILRLGGEPLTAMLHWNADVKSVQLWEPSIKFFQIRRWTPLSRRFSRDFPWFRSEDWVHPPLNEQRRLRAVGRLSEAREALTATCKPSISLSVSNALIKRIENLESQMAGSDGTMLLSANLVVPDKPKSNPVAMITRVVPNSITITPQFTNFSFVVFGTNLDQVNAVTNANPGKSTQIKPLLASGVDTNSLQVTHDGAVLVISGSISNLNSVGPLFFELSSKNGNKIVTLPVLVTLITNKPPTNAVSLVQFTHSVEDEFGLLQSTSYKINISTNATDAQINVAGNIIKSELEKHKPQLDTNTVMKVLMNENHSGSDAAMNVKMKTANDIKRP